MKKQKASKSTFPYLSPHLNKAPPAPGHIHLMGICGTGMASLAGILKERGIHVTGSDENVYPPMSLLLEKLGIPVRKGYSPQNLSPPPDLAVVGNVITRQNPEAAELARRKIPYLSMPQALRLFAMDEKKSIVIAGTHGKTTTCGITSWLLHKAGMDPGFMIGGVPVNFQVNFRLGDGPFFVIEGDEYDTAFFDKGPKFLHYAPWAVILTSIEFDHADIFRDLNHVRETFERFIKIIPPEGLLIANGDDPVILSAIKKAKCSIITYGLREGCRWRPSNVSLQEDLTYLTVMKDEKEFATIKTSLYGLHNISNLIAATALSDYLDMSVPVLSEAVASFRGIRRRQEIRGEKMGVLIIDDFAHHPTAVKETVSAVKNRFKKRRLVAVFEPRSNSSRRSVFQESYAGSFDPADIILIPEPPMMDKIPPDERFSSEALVESLNQKGLTAFYCPDTGHLMDKLIKLCRKGDVFLIMSNGSFDNIHEKLLEKIA